MKKILLSSVALLSLVTTLPVNSPVSAQESISPKAYNHSNGSWIQSNGRWLYKTLKTGETSTRAVPIEDVNAMEKVFSNQNFSKVVRFPDKTKAEIIANMQELFKSSSESDKTAFSGWNSLQNKIISNTDGKITLEKLYQYSYPLVLEDASKIHEEQHVSVYPENSQFVLFQK